MAGLIVANDPKARRLLAQIHASLNTPPVPPHRPDLHYANANGTITLAEIKVSRPAMIRRRYPRPALHVRLPRAAPRARRARRRIVQRTARAGSRKRPRGSTNSDGAGRAAPARRGVA
jgi:hypothetical protein